MGELGLEPRAQMSHLEFIVRNPFPPLTLMAWHCFMGRDSGSYMTHETRHLVVFYLGQAAFLLKLG